MPGVNSGLASTDEARSRYTSDARLHGCTKLGPDEYRGAPPRYTPAPSSRAARKLAADVCHKNSNHGRNPPMCTGKCKLGSDVYHVELV